VSAAERHTKSPTIQKSAPLCVTQATLQRRRAADKRSEPAAPLGVCRPVLAQSTNKKPRIRGAFSSEADGTRTRNHRIDSPDHIPRKPIPFNPLGEHTNRNPADSPATELAQLVIAWQHLTPTTRSAIHMLIEADRTDSSKPPASNR
jgi:hypothetical protein